MCPSTANLFWESLPRVFAIDCSRFVSWVLDDVLLQERFGLNIRKKFITVRVVRPWHMLARGAVDAPSLKRSKSGWMELGAILSGGRSPCPWQRAGRR